MQKINKGDEPASLSAWIRTHPLARYDDLTEVEREAIREYCTKEQYYLCAYCCQKISGQKSDTMNEHIEARRTSPQRSLSFNNIVASCTTPKQCDNSHGAQHLPLTPLMDECETELRFKISGRVEGLTERAIETIRVLNLGDNEINNKKLIEKRKQLSYSLLFVNGVNPDEGLDDDELIQLVVDDIGTAKGGELEAFAPVVVNILRAWLSDEKSVTTSDDQ